MSGDVGISESESSAAKKASDESSTVEEEEQDSTADTKIGNTPRDIAMSNFNLDLLPGVRQDFRNVNWYKVSATTFFIGVYVVVLWALFVSAILAIDYLIEAPTVITILQRLLTVVPLAFPILGIFGVIARWSWRRMENTPDPSKTVIGQIKSLSVGSSSTLFTISILSIVLALAFRAVIHAVSVDLYGSGLTANEVVSVAFLDGIYIGLLLIGFGGLISLTFTDEEKKEN